MGNTPYVTNNFFNFSVSVIDTTTTPPSVAMIPVGGNPSGAAVTPDGKHVYVANNSSNTVSVIDTATNTVGTTMAVPQGAGSVAVTPDGKHAYVTGNVVSVIATATNTVVATVTVGTNPFGVAVAPDGKHAYVTNASSNNVSVIDTATNTVEAATIAVGANPAAVAITPDGKRAYVANRDSNNVSVIDTATNTVVATVLVGNNPDAVGIMPPPVGVPFLAFDAKLEIDLDHNPKEDRFELQSHFTLSSTAPRLHPVVEPVTLQIGTSPSRPAPSKSTRARTRAGLSPSTGSSKARGWRR